MYNWKNVFHNYLIVAPICVVCGLIVACTIVPAYNFLGIIREWGQLPLASDQLSSETKYFILYSFVGYSFLLAVYLTCLRDRIWLILGLYIILSPTWFFSLFAGFFTDTKGIWYRGILNGVCWISLPLWHWLLTINIVQRLPQKKILK